MTPSLCDRLLLVRGKMTQAEFARKMNVNPNTLRSYERGAAIPNLTFLARLCTEFDVSPKWILLGEGHIYNMQSNEASEGDSYDYRQENEELKKYIKELEIEKEKAIQGYIDVLESTSNARDNVMKALGRSLRVVARGSELINASEKYKTAYRELFSAAIIAKDPAVIDEVAENIVFPLIDDSLTREQVEELKQAALTIAKKEVNLEL